MQRVAATTKDDSFFEKVNSTTTKGKERDQSGSWAGVFTTLEGEIMGRRLKKILERLIHRIGLRSTEEA